MPQSDTYIAKDSSVSAAVAESLSLSISSFTEESLAMYVSDCGTCLLYTSVFAITFVLFLVLYFVYFRFAPKDGMLVILTPICFQLHIPLQALRHSV